MAEVTDPDLLSKLNAADNEVTDPALLSQLNAAPSPGWKDFFKSVPRGFLKGAVGAASALGQAEAPLDMPPDQAAAVPGQEQSTQLVEQNLTGNLHRPETKAGKYGETIGEFLGNPGSYVGPGGMAAKAVTAATGGAGSEFLGQAAEGTKYEPLARFIGAIVGGHTPNMGARAVTPLPMAPEQRAIVDALHGEGVTGMTAGTATGSKGLRYAESALSDMWGAGGGAEAAQREALGQYTAAALRRVGENADRATPEVVDRAFNRIGGEFDRLTAANDMNLDHQVQNDLLNTAIDYQNNVNPLMQSPLIENTMNDIASWAGSQGGSLTGRQYQNLRSRLARAARGSSDPQYSHALSDMSESLDDAMERSIANSNPADAGAFGEARRQYRNMLVIERAATGPGAQAAEGFITPSQLATATKAVMGRRAYARGQGDFADLAHSGNAALLPLPQSGTAPRAAITEALHHLALGGLLGAGGEYAGGPMAGLGAAAAGLAGPAIAGRTLMSSPIQAYLRNQAVPGRLNSSPATQAIINTLMGAGQ